MILRLTTVIAIAAIALVAVSDDTSFGHNTWNGGYRKWPWKADISRGITTLPNTPPHSSETNQLAMDIGMNFDETVYSVSPGTRYSWTDVFCFGWTLIYGDNDSSYILYAHLREPPYSNPPVGSVVAGQPIAKTGNTGSEDNNLPYLLCSSAAHLHFARYSSPPAFDMSDRNRQLSLEPISGHGQPFDALQGSCTYYPPPCTPAGYGYLSDNAGIGFDIGDGPLTPIAAAYVRGAGYNGIGATANIAEAWSPCRNDTIYGTWWRYSCNPRAGITGEVQTYYFGSANQHRRAIMWKTGSPSSSAYIMWGGILKAYVQLWAAHDWVYWLGYPTADTVYFSSGNYHFQTFQEGYAVWHPATCLLDMYTYASGFIQQYTYCPD